MSDQDMYCGVGKIPKGKIRATPEYCVQNNQVRYYGLVAIDQNLLKSAKGESSNLTKERLKFQKAKDEAEILLKDIQTQKLIVEKKNEAKDKVKVAQKK